MRRADTTRARDEGFRPYRDLAVRVLACAFRDLTNAGRSSDRESARLFLAGSGMMRYWCQVAALDPTGVADHAETLIANRKSREALHASPMAVRRDVAAAVCSIGRVTGDR
jgi:hypothetical protein